MAQVCARIYVLPLADNYPKSCERREQYRRANQCQRLNFKREAKIDFSKSTIKVKRHKMILSGIDNSDGVDVEASISSLRIAR